jgi:hypothetical protein
MIRTWFRWRGGNNVHRRTGPVVVMPVIPKTRQLRNTEIYSKLFYTSKLKSMVDAETAGMSLTQSQRFAKLQEVTKREWALESDEVKEQV